MDKWVTFFSQSGSEIAAVASKLNRVPDLIVTNERPSNLRTLSPQLLNLGANIVYLPNKPTSEDYMKVLSELGVNPGNTLVTLHGWLRIVPKEVIVTYPYLFNGHPGLITKYPELKGKDPQLKAFNLNLHTSGCVIHKVTEGVDEGSILRDKEVSIKDLSLGEVFETLHETSIKMWVSFIKRHWLKLI